MTSKQTNWQITMDTLAQQQVFPTTINRILFWSPEPGTGKSSWATRYFGADRVERITMHGELLPEDALYTVELEAENGGTKTVRRDGPVIRAMRAGKILVIDEIDQHSASMRALLHSILDDSSLAQIQTPTEVIKPASGFAVVATTNSNPDELTRALRDRFDLVLNCDLPARDILAAMPRGAQSLLENHYARVTKSEWITTMSVRSMQSYLKLSACISSEQAAELVFGINGPDVLNTIACAESEAAK